MLPVKKTPVQTSLSIHLLPFSLSFPISKPTNRNNLLPLLCLFSHFFLTGFLPQFNKNRLRESTTKTIYKNDICTATDYISFLIFFSFTCLVCYIPIRNKPRTTFPSSPAFLYIFILFFCLP